MSLQPVGVEYRVEGAPGFFSSIDRSNAAIRSLGTSAAAASNAFPGAAQIIEGALERIGGIITETAFAAVDALRGMIAEGVRLNASAEQSAVAFTTLLKSGEAAQAFLEELRQFAAATPFEFPELQDAARKLLAFGFEAKEIIPLLTSVGDAVGALGGGAEEINRVVFAIGQMQTKGKVANEELLQLAELGIPVYQILGDAFGKTTNEIQDMVSRGLVPAEAGIAALTKGMDQMFGGAMIAQAQTFNGILSTLKDNLSLALMSFTGPVFEQMKSSLMQKAELVASESFQTFAVVAGKRLGEAFAVVNQYIQNIIGAFRQMLPAITVAIGGIEEVTTMMADWGAEAIAQFASGMWESIKSVVAVIVEIGKTIAYWLAPGSPPRILPELPAWGTSAVNEFMKGWANPDMSAFSELKGVLESALQDLVSTEQISNVDLQQLLFGGQNAIAQAVEEFRQFGQVSETTFQNISAAAGPAGGTVEAFARTYFELETATRDVARAQEELNRITDEYASKLDPLNKQLKSIQDQKAAIRDAERLKELEKDLAEGKLEGADADLARLEIEEIRLRQQIKGIEEARDAEVEAAQVALDAAEQKQSAAQEQLSLQSAQNSLVSDQNKLLAESIRLQKQLAQEAAPKGGGSGGGGGGGRSLGLGDIKLPAGGETEGSPAEAIQTVTDAVLTAKSAYGEWSVAIEDTSKKVTDASNAFLPAATAITTFLNGVNSSGAIAKSVLGEEGLAGAVVVFGNNLAIVNPVAGEFISNYGPALLTVLGGIGLAFERTYGSIVNVGVILGVLPESLLPATSSLGAVSKGANAASEAAGTFNAALLPLQVVLTALGYVIGQIIISQLTALAVTFASTAAPIIVAVVAISAAMIAWQTNFVGVRDVIQQVLGSLFSLIGSILDGIRAYWDANGAEILATVQAHWGPILGQIETVLRTIGDIVSGVLGFVQDLWEEHGTAILDNVTLIFNQVSGIVSGVISFLLVTIGAGLRAIYDFFVRNGEGIKNIVSGSFQAISGVIQVALAVIQGIVRTVLNLLQGNWKEAWEDIKELVRGVVTGLGNILSGLWNVLRGGFEIALTEAVKAAKSLGLDTIAGLVQGLKNAAGSVADALKGIIDAAIAAVKKALGIASPSRVFKVLGLQSGEGFEIGAVESLTTAMNSIEELLSSLSDVAGKQAQEIADKVRDVFAQIEEDSIKGTAALRRGVVTANRIAPRTYADAADKEAADAKAAVEKLRKDLDEARKDFTATNLELIGGWEELRNVESAIAKLAGDDSVKKQLAQISATYDMLAARKELGMLTEQEATQLKDITAKRKELLDLEETREENLQKLQERREEIYANAPGLTEDVAAAKQKELEVQQDLWKAEAEQARAAQRYQKTVQLGLETRTKVAEIQERARTMAQTDADAAARYLDFALGQLDEERDARQAVIDRMFETDHASRQEELEEILKAQQLERELFQKQEEKRLAERANQLRELADEYESFIARLLESGEYGEIGAQVIRGISEGIMSQLSQLSTSMGAVRNQIITSLRQLLGIASPSKVLGKEIGGPSGKGIIVGMVDELKNLPAILAAIMDTASKDVTRAWNGDAVSLERGASQNTSISSASTVQNQYFYQPSYNSAPATPLQDFAAMRVLQGT